MPGIRYEGLPHRIHPNDFMLKSYSNKGCEAAIAAAKTIAWQRSLK